MSNRNFDNRVIIQRLQNQVYARNLYLNNTTRQAIINNPQNSDGNSSRFNSFVPGAQTEYFRGLIGAGGTVSVGGIVNIPSIQNIPVPVSAPIIIPSPAPAPAPAYTSNTQLLINPEFTDIVSNGATGWTSSRGWQEYSGVSASAPTAVITIPTRDVYPVGKSDPSGFIIFSFTSSTISQTVTISNLIDVNTITGILNIANVINNKGKINFTNNGIDTFTFKIEYKSSTGVVLYTNSTGITSASDSWTDYILILTRATSPNFDAIKSITVSITGIDTGFWAGQYGPAMDYCRLTVS